MSRGISVNVGTAYETNGAFVIVERIVGFFEKVMIKGYDTKLQRWLSWEVDMGVFLHARQEGLKRRSKPHKLEIGLGNANLPESIRPGDDAAVCL